MSKFHSMMDVRAANAARGYHWFEPATMRFFHSRVSDVLISGRYFVSSEQPPHGPRRYSVRRAEDGGDIRTVGEFMGYPTSAAARRAAEKLPADPRPCVWCDASTYDAGRDGSAVCAQCQARDN